MNVSPDEAQQLRDAEETFKDAGWRKRRLDICLSCPALIPAFAGVSLTERCSLCGCFVRLKTKLKSQTCAFKPPLWKAVEDVSEKCSSCDK